MKENGKTHVLVWGLIVSVSLHVVVLLQQLPTLDDTFLATSPPPSNEPIEIVEVPPELLEPPPQLPKKKLKTKEKQIVETEKLKNQELDPEATYLSDTNQTAEQQSRAQRTDDFRSKQGEGLKGSNFSQEMESPPTGEQSEAKAKPEETTVADGAEPTDKEKKKQAGIKRDWKSLSLKDLSVNGDGKPDAATDDYLADVPYGQRTILSTREFRFYSYYFRVKELLRQYWKPKVQGKIHRMMQKGKRIRESERITKVLVLLNRQGEILKVSRLAGSGLREVDSAAVEAFHAAAPFPNPPDGMVDPDGLIRIRWDFILRTEASPQIQFSGSRRRRRRGPR